MALSFLKHCLPRSRSCPRAGSSPTSTSSDTDLLKSFQISFLIWPSVVGAFLQRQGRAKETMATFFNEGRLLWHLFWRFLGTQPKSWEQEAMTACPNSMVADF